MIQAEKLELFKSSFPDVGDSVLNVYAEMSNKKNEGNENRSFRNFTNFWLAMNQGLEMIGGSKYIYVLVCKNGRFSLSCEVL